MLPAKLASKIPRAFSSEGSWQPVGILNQHLLRSRVLVVVLGVGSSSSKLRLCVAGGKLTLVALVVLVLLVTRGGACPASPTREPNGEGTALCFAKGGTVPN